jgi:hypothetical protein
MEKQTIYLIIQNQIFVNTIIHRNSLCEKAKYKIFVKEKKKEK